MSEVDLLWQRVLDAAEVARRAEQSGRDCTKEDRAYMNALINYYAAVNAGVGQRS